MLGPFNRFYFNNQLRVGSKHSRSPSEHAGGFGSSFGGTYGAGAQARRDHSSDGTFKRNESIIRRQTAEWGATGATSDLVAMQNNGMPLPLSVNEKSINYKDVALIREMVLESEVEFFDGNKQDILRVVSDHGFMNTF